MLRLVYRSYAGENWKNRPAFYTKRLALLSFARAVEASGAELEVLFINDGPVPDEILEIQRPLGRVIELPRVGMRRSYLQGLRAPSALGWADDDLVWYSEDDYLYRPDAFTHLVAAAKALPEADYFALYGVAYGRQPEGEVPPRPRGWQPSVAGTVDGVRWERILSTASSFGGRAGAFKADFGIFKFCTVPHRTMYRDHDTCVVVQGFEPHPYGELLRGLVSADGRSAKRWARDASLLPFLVATNVRAHRRLANRRLFVAAVPNLVTHLEADKLAPGTRWDQVALDVEAWAAARAAATVALDQRVVDGARPAEAADAARP
ncbi:MAG TPA: glycosyltransferase [Kineosporiaceae bacterium]